MCGSHSYTKLFNIIKNFQDLKTAFVYTQKKLNDQAISDDVFLVKF